MRVRSGGREPKHWPGAAWSAREFWPTCGSCGVRLREASRSSSAVPPVAVTERPPSPRRESLGAGAGLSPRREALLHPMEKSRLVFPSIRTGARLGEPQRYASGGDPGGGAPDAPELRRPALVRAPLVRSARARRSSGSPLEPAGDCKSRNLAGASPASGAGRRGAGLVAGFVRIRTMVRSSTKRKRVKRPLPLGRPLPGLPPPGSNLPLSPLRIRSRPCLTTARRARSTRQYLDLSWEMFRRAVPRPRPSVVRREYDPDLVIASRAQGSSRAGGGVDLCAVDFHR
jgi:hypothetical protein